MRHRRGSTMLAVVAVAALLGTESAAGAAAPLTKCTEVKGVPSALCGSVDVPLDRANPAAGTTTVAFALVPRRNAAAPSAGTILFNPGGPGAATIVDAARIAEGFAPLLDRRDLLLVDPRGTGRSSPLVCRALDPALVFAPRARFIDAIGACGRELGPSAGHYGSAAVADDFEAVRAALGLGPLDLWGESYGTYLMPVYAVRHPAGVRSMVLSGTYPIDFDPWGLDRLGAARKGVRLVCARTRACRAERVLEDVAALAQRLRDRPATITVTAGSARPRVRLDERALAAAMYTGGNASAFGALPAAAAAGRAGDLAPLRRLHEVSLLATAFFFGQEGAASLAQSFATQCHDYPRSFSYADAPAARRTAYLRARAAIGRRAFFPFSPAAWTGAGFEAADTCIAWPADPTAAPPVAAGTAMPDVPVLVLSGDLDANTPSFAGRVVAHRFARATFAEIPNEGHTPTGSPCARRLALRFVVTGTANPGGCAGTGSPPRVLARAARHAEGLTPTLGVGTRADRRALAVVVATANDLSEMLPYARAYGRVRAFRGGRYVVEGNRVRLAGAHVVHDARMSGTLTPTARGISGTVRLAGAGIPDGRLTVRLRVDGRGRASGTLGGRRVSLRFRAPDLRIGGS
jgi:pimeloyl-ACP methyl ester carboxylesterase